jgi:ferritin-like metal-binding protein YciE
MAEQTQRDAKLVQYLNEAYGKEKELEVALESHIAMTSRAPYKKRLQQHLKETKNHGRQLERRIKKLGGGGRTLQSITSKALATAKSPLHAIRGTNEQERMLKNAKTEYFNEHEEIATYRAIEEFASQVGDRETAKVARGIRREEERMANFLERLIPQLTKAVVRASVPSDQRDGGRTRRRTSGTRRRTSARSSSRAQSTSSARRRSLRRS